MPNWKQDYSELAKAKSVAKKRRVQIQKEIVKQAVIMANIARKRTNINHRQSIVQRQSNITKTTAPTKRYGKRRTVQPTSTRSVQRQPKKGCNCGKKIR